MPGNTGANIHGAEKGRFYNMRTRSSSLSARAALSTLLVLAAIALLCAIPFVGTRAQNPASGTITATGSPVTWTGTTISPGGNTDESTCIDTVPGKSCETFTLTVGGVQSDWVGKRVQVLLTWTSGGNEYDIYIHKGSNAGAVVASAIQGPGQTSQVAYIDVAQFGTGVFTVHVAYDVTPTSATDPYHGKASAVSTSIAQPPPAPAATGAAVGYENFEAPGLLTPVNVTTGPTVEWMGRNAGEPSLGNNWKTGVTNYQSDLETLFISFAPSCGGAGTNAVWQNRPAPTSQVIDSDPIGFTDRLTNRTFAGELSATSPSCKISYTDDDGATWVATSGPLGSGIDHETIGGGPYHSPLVGTPAYPNAVYYCSQDLVTAFCLRSDNGGANWGPPVTTYTTECGGLHGHVKVSPKDGTVYLPNGACGGTGAVVVSEDNGVTWNIRPVGNSTITSATGASDPAVAIDANGRVYFAMANADATALVATSDDRGKTWQNIFDVGASFGLKNIRYPAAVAGDAGRAAIAFYGTATPGNANAASFNGIWHLYVAHTFDGGLTWTTTDATPNAPIQRGCIWTGGGANICRNLLDFFDITISKDGRVQVGYVNGCPGGDCAQAASTASGNAYAATATIARQSSGRRMIAASDPPSSVTIPGTPFVTQRRLGPVVHLSWSEADTGNSPITGYQVLRGIVTGGESATPIATVPAGQTSFDDTAANDPAQTYYYKIIAVNSAGSSCGNNEVAAPYRGDRCTGVTIHQNLPSHPESAAANANPQLAIDSISVGEPPSTTNFMFKMKVSNLSTIPPNSRWRIVWDSYASKGQQYYVGMRSDSSSAVSFDYGEIATAVVGLVVGVPTETKLGAALATSNFKADGTITIFVPKASVGSPKAGDLLGAVNGRTFTGDTAQTATLERSTALIDHTFVKAQTDAAYPPATYTVGDNSACDAIAPPPSPTPAAPALLLNISTRADVLTGDKIPIAGFIITGTDPKKVIVRALGGSVPVSGRLADPLLELHGPSGFTTVTNNNWQDSQKDEIIATSLQPSNNLESAIVRTLNPGTYTAVMRSNDSSTGIGLVEAYDLSQNSASVLANISTRGFVETNDKIMIAGFISGPVDRGNPTLVLRALGPSLTNFGVANTLQDPTLELHDPNGNTVASNDDWATDPRASFVAAAGLAPSDTRESALDLQVTPGIVYTVLVKSKDGSSGASLVEVYRIP